jgi:cell division protein FtsB
MQVDKLKSQLETQNSEKVNWETRVEKLEKKIHDLNSKLEDVSCTFGLIVQFCFEINLSFLFYG